MKLFNTRRRKALGTALTCAVAGIASLAFAAWLTDGEGPGTSKGGQLVAPTVEPNPSANFAGMLPGQTGYGGFTVTNPNPVALRVTAIAEPLNPTAGTSSAGVNCPASNVSINRRSLNGSGPVVQANSAETVNVADAYRLAADAPTACQGATFEVPARLTFSTLDGG